MVDFDLTELGHEECEDDNNEIETEPTDETKPPMGVLDALRVLARGAKKLTKAKFDDPGYGFSLLKFYSEERVPHKAAFTLLKGRKQTRAPSGSCTDAIEVAGVRV